MRQAGLAGVSRRKGCWTTRRNQCARPAPDLVERQFTAEGPDKLWVADITYIPTWTGFLFLSVVLDVFSRRIVGWAIANHLRTELILDALNMAIARRRPEVVIHHSDQLPVHVDRVRLAVPRGRRTAEHGLDRRLLRHAMCESFFATFECELLVKHRFRSQAHAIPVVFRFHEHRVAPHLRLPVAGVGGIAGGPAVDPRALDDRDDAALCTALRRVGRGRRAAPERTTVNLDVYLPSISPGVSSVP